MNRRKDERELSHLEGEVELQRQAAEHRERELFEREVEDQAAGDPLPGGGPLAKAERRSKRIRSLKAIVEDYRTLRLSDPIISQAAAARVLCVHPTRVGELVDQGKLVQLRFPALSVIGVTIASLDAYLQRRRKMGLSDAATELRRLREEETNEINETE